MWQAKGPRNAKRPSIRAPASGSSMARGCGFYGWPEDFRVSSMSLLWSMALQECRLQKCCMEPQKGSEPDQA